MFQFQYGAIGSSGQKAKANFLSSFNSSMVRLGVKLMYSGELFQLVSIPVWCDWENTRFRRKFFYRSFNSSMVRLGAKVILLDYFRNLVSIPVWCDWESCSLSSTCSCSLFQFQYGAIGSNFNCFGSYSLENVSIPVWCDWEQKNTSSIYKGVCWFQFQYGAIGSGTHFQEIPFAV